eukprot:1177736-Amphidinium_carterae.2
MGFELYSNTQSNAEKAWASTESRTLLHPTTHSSSSDTACTRTCDIQLRGICCSRWCRETLACIPREWGRSRSARAGSAGTCGDEGTWG